MNEVWSVARRAAHRRFGQLNEIRMLLEQLGRYGGALAPRVHEAVLEVLVSVLRVPKQKLDEHQRVRKHVDTRADLPPLNRLGREVCKSAAGRSCVLRAVLGAHSSAVPINAKLESLTKIPHFCRPVPVNEYIVRLEIAVNDGISLLVMQKAETPGHVKGNGIAQRGPGLGVFIQNVS